MATTEHFRDGGGTTFNFSFPKLENSDLKVAIYNTSTKQWDLKTENTTGQTDNDYSIVGTNVVFNNTTPSGTGNIHIYRKTNVDVPQAYFAAGSSIRAIDLNNNQTQLLYSTQESHNQLIQETDLDDSIITSAKLRDGTIVNADINASADIDGSKLLNDSVALTKLGSGALPTDITVASANIVDGTISNADIHTSAAIDGTKISPAFGSQNISTTGTLDSGTITVTGTEARINFTDTSDNPDYAVLANFGLFA